MQLALFYPQVFKQRISQEGKGKKPSLCDFSTKKHGNIKFGMWVGVYQNFFRIIGIVLMKSFLWRQSIFSKNFVIFATTHKQLNFST